MNNKLLKATVLALVLVFGSLQGMVWASAGSQPDSFLYPVGMAIGKMGLTTTVAEITEVKLKVELAQKQADGCGDCDLIRDRDGTCDGDVCDPIRDRDRDGICDGDDCEPIRDRDRDGICDGDVCDPIRDRDRDGICDGDVCEPIRDRDRDGTCDGDDCEPAGDQDRDRDGTCDGDDCEPIRDQDRDRDGGGQGGGGHH